MQFATGKRNVLALFPVPEAQELFLRTENRELRTGSSVLLRYRALQIHRRKQHKNVGLQ